MHEIIDKKLQDINRKPWFDEESLKLSSDASSFQVAIDILWKRVKGASRLKRNQLAIVQTIAQWREQLAQQLDKTRRRILADDVIIELALSPPEKIESLNPIIDYKYNFNQQQKQQLFQAIDTALQATEDSWPDNRFAVLDNEQKTLLKTLQQQVNTKAEQMHISATMLYTKKDLEKLILEHANKTQPYNKLAIEKLNNSSSWRYQCIGQQLVETVKNTK